MFEKRDEMRLLSNKYQMIIAMSGFVMLMYFAVLLVNVLLFGFEPKKVIVVNHSFHAPIVRVTSSNAPQDVTIATTENFIGTETQKVNVSANKYQFSLTNGTTWELYVAKYLGNGDYNDTINFTNRSFSTRKALTYQTVVVKRMLLKAKKYDVILSDSQIKSKKLTDSDLLIAAHLYKMEKKAVKPTKLNQNIISDLKLKYAYYLHQVGTSKNDLHGGTPNLATGQFVTH
ncbi:MAG: hypothetical protein ABF754_06020 [Leuconostoc pseudomesenteroides]|uniref:hypothetical protein n=1 Tax=Leuconostoc pseudomesenteroides TaxID=33968 RepID=UPI0039ED6294